jgi:hypothetical protein
MKNGSSGQYKKNLKIQYIIRENFLNLFLILKRSAITSENRMKCVYYTRSYSI